MYLWYQMKPTESPHIKPRRYWQISETDLQVPTLTVRQCSDRLGPGTLCCSACTWTNVSWSNRIQRNYKGLKITACMCSWGKLWRRYKKTKNPTATSEVSRAKAGCCAWSLHPAPPREWADDPSLLSSPTQGSTPTLTPFKGPAHPPLRQQARGAVTCFHPPVLQWESQ